eukprot:jgi/Psemu1/48718/gm1.48718_g
MEEIIIKEIAKEVLGWPESVKYEVGFCLKTGWIVWINGPFVGSKNDGTIFKKGLSNLLHDNEAVEVDRGYRGDDKMKLPDMGFTRIERKMKSNTWSQHETVNGRLKIFNILTSHFWHMKPNRQGMMQKHKICFEAVAVITQLKFVSGETTFEDGLEYDIPSSATHRIALHRIAVLWFRSVGCQMAVAVAVNSVCASVGGGGDGSLPLPQALAQNRT